jgi:hypothetical protein
MTFRSGAGSDVIRAKLRDRKPGFAWDYLRAVAERIVVQGDVATVTGSNARLIQAAGPEPALCTHQDSDSPIRRARTSISSDVMFPIHAPLPPPATNDAVSEPRAMPNK